jgi:spore maturation protein SpmA
MLNIIWLFLILTGIVVAACSGRIMGKALLIHQERIKAG